LQRRIGSRHALRDHRRLRRVAPRQSGNGPDPATRSVGRKPRRRRELIAAVKATDQFKALLPIMQGLKPAIVQGRPGVEKDFDTLMPVILDGASQRGISSSTT
jgi:hypothetical protein